MNWIDRRWPAWRQAAQARAAEAVQRWRQLSRREQKALLMLAGATAALALWMLLLRPAWRDMAQARKELPRLQYEQAELQAVLDQIRVLEQQAGQTPVEQGQDKALERSLQVLGTQCRVQAGQTRVVACQSAPAAALMDWLLRYPRLLGLEVQALELTRSVVDSRERPGLLDGRIELRAGASS